MRLESASQQIVSVTITPLIDDQYTLYISTNQDYTQRVRLHGSPVRVSLPFSSHYAFKPLYPARPEPIFGQTVLVKYFPLRQPKLMDLVKQPNNMSYMATVDVSEFSDHVRTLGGRNCDTFKPGLWTTNTFEAARIDTICFMQELDGVYGEPLFIEVDSDNDTESN